MNTDKDTQIKKLFAAYEKRFNEALLEKPIIDTKGVVSSFADYFVGSSPAGVRGAKNGWLFKLFIARGFAHYKKIGTAAMKIVSLEITHLDDLHAMAKVHWDSRYLKKDGTEEKIEFDNFYFLALTGDAPKIFAYITGDEEKTLKQHGIT